MNLKNLTSLISIAILSCYSCSWNPSDCITGNGIIEERTIDLGNDISKIYLEIGADIILSEGLTQKITIEGSANLIDQIESDSEIIGNEWKIMIEGCSVNDGITINAQLKSIEELSIEGSGIILSENQIQNVNNLKLEIEGSGNINLDILSANQIDTEIEGSGDIVLTGVSNKTIFDIEGSGEIKAKNLSTKESQISIEGSGEIEVCVSDKLDVRIEGSGDVCYKGSPTVTIDIEGSGNVTECN